MLRKKEKKIDLDFLQDLTEDFQAKLDRIIDRKN